MNWNDVSDETMGKMSLYEMEQFTAKCEKEEADKEKLKYRVDMMVALVQGGAKYEAEDGIVRIELPDDYIMDFTIPRIYKK
jgi:hypothetical protein